MFKGVIIILRGRKDVPSIFGCIDTLAFNYDPSANTDNNTCKQANHCAVFAVDPGNSLTINDRASLLYEGWNYPRILILL